MSLIYLFLFILIVCLFAYSRAFRQIVMLLYMLSSSLLRSAYNKTHIKLITLCGEKAITNTNAPIMRPPQKASTLLNKFNKSVD